MRLFLLAGPLFLAAALLAAPLLAEAALRGSYAWGVDMEGFGGFSAIHMDADGSGFVAIGDRGTRITGRITRTEGRITGIETDPLRPLLGPDGAELTPGMNDAEGIAVDAQGRVYLSFEGPARVMRHDSLDAAGTLLPAHPGFAGMQHNAALEALAIDAQGRLYTIPERSGRPERPFPVYRFADGAWSIPFTLPRRGAFLVVGADFGPDGRLYVLERDFGGIGFRSRVRRFDADGGGETDVMQSRLRAHDNLEGISVWRDAAGRLTMTLISDDNEMFFQRTELVEYLLPD